MIIGISGKKQSVKNTVANIIQYLIAQKNGFCPNGLNSYTVGQLETGSNWEQKQFAGKLKEIICILTGCSLEDLEKEEFKNSFLPKEWNIDNRRITYRWLLQSLGTDVIREIHGNAWINALMREYKEVDGYDIHNEYIRLGGKGISTLKDKVINDRVQEKLKDYIKRNTSNWIITDVRFPNELNTIKEKKGIVIRVNRYHIDKCTIGLIHNKNCVADVTCYECNHYNQSNHPSETSLDNARFDYVIDNDGTVEELIEKVKQILIKENIV